MVSMVSPKGSDANGTQAIAPHGHETRNSARAVGRAARQGSAGSQETSGWRASWRGPRPAEGGKCEKFKTTQTFDGTEQHKEWLTSARL